MLASFKKFRPFLLVAVLVLTVAVFAYYFASHPAVRSQLRHTSPLLFALLLALYIVSIGVIGLILVATLVLCRVPIGIRESTLLTMYSAIVNFFGPLQSGPAVRAVYLKKKHGLKLKDYGIATLGYYAFYGAFSMVLLFSGVLGWWLVPLGIASCSIMLWVLRSSYPLAQRFRTLNLRGLGFLAAATAVQVVVITAIYYAELHSVVPHIRLQQAVIYTGAANLALFVSITPGAIGFRESFLALSQRLHHVSNNAIVTANIIDRAVYVVVLLLLLVVIVLTHAQTRFRPATPDKA